MILSLDFDGFRAFPCRRQHDRGHPFQRLVLAPLTVLLGRNNAGKSSIAALLRQVICGLAGDGGEALPLVVSERRVADTFQDLIHARLLSSFLELGVDLIGGDGAHRLETTLHLGGFLDGEPRPYARRWSWDGVEHPLAPGPLLGGLLGPLGNRTDLEARAGGLSQESVWLGPLRQRIAESPRRGERFQGLPALGPAGEGLTNLLSQDERLFAGVTSWLQAHASVKLRWEKNLDLWRLQARRGDLGTIPVGQLGTGIHQLLPVLALTFWRREGGGESGFIDVIEQPELHLHDALQPELGDLFLDLAMARRGTTIVETHSEGLLLRIRRRIAEGADPALVALYFVDDAPDGSTLRKIPIEANGEVGWWPDGVFLESFEEVKALRRAQRRREG